LIEAPSENMQRRKTILVVEDDPSLRQLYWQALTFEGFHVLTAEDGVTALDCLQHEKPALIVLDLNVPRVSGWDLYRELAARPETRTIPIIVVTGVEPADVATQAAALLTKPVHIHRVVQEVYRHVNAA